MHPLWHRLFLPIFWDSDFKAEGRRQRAEGRRQKAEGRRQKAEGGEKVKVLR